MAKKCSCFSIGESLDCDHVRMEKTSDLYLDIVSPQEQQRQQRYERYEATPRRLERQAQICRTLESLIHDINCTTPGQRTHRPELHMLRWESQFLPVGVSIPQAVLDLL